MISPPNNEKINFLAPPPNNEKINFLAPPLRGQEVGQEVGRDVPGRLGCQRRGRTSCPRCSTKPSSRAIAY